MSLDSLYDLTLEQLMHGCVAVSTFELTSLVDVNGCLRNGALGWRNKTRDLSGAHVPANGIGATYSDH